MRPIAASVKVRGKAGRESGADEYERHRGAVLAMLAKRFPRLDEDERLAIYHDAWARVYAKRGRGERIESLRAYLLATAGAEALNALTRRRPPAPVGPDDPRLALLADERDGVEDEVVTRDQARIARDLIDSLDQRQRAVLKLRWDLQLDSEEVRAALGLSRRQYQRLVEEGAAAVAERVRELESGAWSRRQRSLLTACLVEADGGARKARGIVSPQRRKEAQRLLESDPHVAALYVEVRSALRRAAALLPLPALFPTADAWGAAPAAEPVPDAGSSGAEVAAADARGAAPGADAGSSAAEAALSGGASAAGRLADLAGGVRGAVGDVVQASKQQATSLYVRAADPALLSSPRPGTAVAALAATIAVGGGAYGTYEAVSKPAVPLAPAAVQAGAASPAPPPVSAPAAAEGRERGEHGDRRRRKRRETKRARKRNGDGAQVGQPAATAAPAAPEPDPQPQPTAAPPAVTTAPAPASSTSGTDEFGFEN